MKQLFIYIYIYILLILIRELCCLEEWLGLLMRVYISIIAAGLVILVQGVMADDGSNNNNHHQEQSMHRYDYLPMPRHMQASYW